MEAGIDVEVVEVEIVAIKMVVVEAVMVENIVVVANSPPLHYRIKSR